MSTEAQTLEAQLAAMRAADGYVGIVEVPLLGPGRPLVTLDLSGVEELVVLGLLVNPLLTLDEPEAPAAAEGATPEPSSDAFWEQARKIAAWQDRILKATVRQPPYANLDEIKEGGRPPGKVCLFDFSQDARRDAVNLLFQGSHALASFRERAERVAAPPAGEDVRPDAEQPPDSPVAVAPPLLAGRGDLDAGSASGLPARGEGRHLVAVPWEPDAEREGHADSLGA